jgi:hypothetical protein
MGDMSGGNHQPEFGVGIVPADVGHGLEQLGTVCRLMGHD